MDPAPNSDDEESDIPESSADAEERGEAGEGGNSGVDDEFGAPVLGKLFDFASSMVTSVQAKTHEIVSTVKETDWASEIEAFKKELQEDTQTVVHRVEDAIEHLPDNNKSKDLQGTLLQVQSQIGEIGRSFYVGTSELISQVNDAFQEEFAANAAAARKNNSRAVSARLGGTAAKYSRFEAEVSAMQRDSSTYCDEPEDQEDYQAWLGGFDLGTRKADIEQIIKDNAFMSELQARIVPLIVEYDAFWTRYFYRLHKLQLKHEQRVQVAQRAKQAVEEEEVSWDDDESADHSGLVTGLAATLGAWEDSDEDEVAGVIGRGPQVDEGQAAGAAEAEPEAAVEEHAADEEPELEAEAAKESTAAQEEEPAGSSGALEAGADEVVEQWPEEAPEQQPKEEAAEPPLQEVATGAAEDGSRAEEVYGSPAAVIATTVDRSSTDHSPTTADDASQSTGIKVTPPLSDEDSAATASEGSSGDHWCVVTSPSKRNSGEGALVHDTAFHEGDGEASQQQASPKKQAALPSAAAAVGGAAASGGDEGVDAGEDVDLSELSGDDVAAGEEEEDIDEDWGLDD